MDNVLDHIIFPIIAMIVLIAIPITLVATGIDNTQRSSADSIVSEYVSEVRSTGVISKQNYEAFIRNLAKTGEVYNINIIHKSKTAIPDGKGEFRVAYRSYGKDEILSYVEGYGEDQEPFTGDDTEPRDYIMKNGDFISIKVTSLEGTTGTKFLDVLSSNPLKGIKITASDGGMVGNTR